MIVGSFSFLSNSCSFYHIEKIKGFNKSKEVDYHHFNVSGFEGGYFINQKLPYKSSDYYYFDSKNDVVVLMSGVIYNRPDLLANCNLTSTTSDPELVATLFHLKGPDFVDSLNGDFAIYIGLNDEKIAFLFRDHLGIRPIAWIIDQNTLFFSSDIIALCRVFADNQPINTDYLLSYFKYIDLRKTPNDRVQKLPPGHYLQFSETGIRIICYWKPEKIKEDKNLKYNTIIKDLKWLIEDAVKIRCDHNFVASAHVTGGLDSGIVSALVRKEYKNQDVFKGFSWAPENFTFETAEYDERDLVLKTCEWTGIKPVFSAMNLNDFLVILNRYYENQGYFSEDDISDQVSDANVNLIFSGWGGDDFVSTAYRGVDQDLLRRLKVRLFFSRNPISKPKKLIKRLLYYVLFPALGIIDNETYRSFVDDARYIQRPYKRNDKTAIRNFFFHSSRKQFHLGMLRFYNLQERAESWFKMGFDKGIEYRYPLLDKRIVEYMLKVPSELLCIGHPYRPILREISKDLLPEEVRLNQDKSEPVYMTFMDELFKCSSVIFMNEVKLWKTNPDLSFVDFDLLEKDLDCYRTNPDNFDDKMFFKSLVQLKALHHFTKEYFS